MDLPPMARNPGYKKLKQKVEKAIKNDGTLIVEVRASFVVSFAAHAHEEMNEDTLAALLDEAGMLDADPVSGSFASCIDGFKVIDANDE